MIIILKVKKSFCKIKYNEKLYKKITTFRNENIAHSLYNKKNSTLFISEIKHLINDIIRIHNDRQFDIDGKNYCLSSDDIKVIDTNACVGVIKYPRSYPIKNTHCLSF